MTRKIFISILVLLLGLTACNQPQTATEPIVAGTEQEVVQTAPTATQPAPTPTESQAPADNLSVDMLRNATYAVTDMAGNLQTYQLVDGIYTQGSPGDTDFVSLSLSDRIAFGDLNADGVEDAAVILHANYGGTGTWVWAMAVLNQSGSPVHAASTLIDDRAIVNSVAIADGELLVDAVIHFINDPMCCPSLIAPRSYRLAGNQLVMMNFASQFQGSASHIITIETPAAGAEVTNPVTITGSVTIAPFENNLVYRIYNSSGELVNQSSLLVDAPDMGMPGTFTLTFDLGMAGVTGLIRVEFWDLSAADGSPIAMDAIFLTLK